MKSNFICWGKWRKVIKHVHHSFESQLASVLMKFCIIDIWIFVWQIWFDEKKFEYHDFQFYYLFDKSNFIKLFSFIFDLQLCIAREVCFSNISAWVTLRLYYCSYNIFTLFCSFTCFFLSNSLLLSIVFQVPTPPSKLLFHS